MHTCGVPPESLNLHTTGHDLYTAPKDALAGLRDGLRCLAARAAARIWRR